MAAVSALEEYSTAILDGKIIACDKIKKVSERMLHDMANPGRFHFDLDIANRHIGFMEKFCKVPSGKLGAPLRFELFQKARLEAIFGFVDDDDLRRFQEVMILEGRKNGKTTETAAIELDLLVNDNEGSPQIYNVATKKDQAKLGFNAANKMRLLSPLLRKHIKKRTSDLYFARNMGYIMPLASDTNTMDGLDVHGATIDELHAIKKRDLYDLIKQGTEARQQPLIFTIGSNGFVRDNIYDAQYEYASNWLDGLIINDRFLAYIYEMDSYDEWLDPEMWIKANPGLGTIKSFEKLKEHVEKAKVDDTFRPTVLVKDFNMKQTPSSAWLRFEDIDNQETFDLDEEKFRYCIGGMDAADSVDLNAAKILCKHRGDDRLYFHSMYWIPQRKLDEMKNRHHPDDAPYDIWAMRGLLQVVPGNKVPKQVFLDWFLEMRDVHDIYPLYIGYDPWHIDDSLLEKFKQEFGSNVMKPIRQGVATLSQPMKELAAEYQAHRIIYNNNPIDKYCLVNTYTKTDINGNIQPDKGQSATKRIDGTAAQLDAFVVYLNNKNEFESLL